MFATVVNSVDIIGRWAPQVSLKQQLCAVIRTVPLSCHTTGEHNLKTEVCLLAANSVLALPTDWCKQPPFYPFKQGTVVYSWLQCIPAKYEI